MRLYAVELMAQIPYSTSNRRQVIS